METTDSRWGHAETLTRHSGCDFLPFFYRHHRSFYSSCPRICCCWTVGFVADTGSRVEGKHIGVDQVLFIPHWETLTQVEGIVNRDSNSFQGHTCFCFTLVRTIRSQWRCFMRRTGPADSHEKSHFPWSAFSLNTFPSLLFHLFSFFSTTGTKLTS